MNATLTQTNDQTITPAELLASALDLLAEQYRQLDKVRQSNSTHAFALRLRASDMCGHCIKHARNLGATDAEIEKAIARR